MRLIDADALVKAMTGYGDPTKNYEKYQYETIPCFFIKTFIDNAPTVMHIADKEQADTPSLAEYEKHIKQLKFKLPRSDKYYNATDEAIAFALECIYRERERFYGGGNNG